MRTISLRRISTTRNGTSSTLVHNLNTNTRSLANLEFNQAFATPNSSSTLSWDSGSQAILKRLVKSAKASGAGTKIVLSVGRLLVRDLVSGVLILINIVRRLGRK